MGRYRFSLWIFCATRRRPSRSVSAETPLTLARQKTKRAQSRLRGVDSHTFSIARRACERSFLEKSGALPDGAARTSERRSRRARLSSMSRLRDAGSELHFNLTYLPTAVCGCWEGHWRQRKQSPSISDVFSRGDMSSLTQHGCWGARNSGALTNVAASIKDARKCRCHSCYVRGVDTRTSLPRDIKLASRFMVHHNAALGSLAPPPKARRH